MFYLKPAISLKNAYDYALYAQSELNKAQNNLNRYNTQFDVVFKTEPKIAGACQTVARMKAQFDLEQAQMQLNKAEERLQKQKKSWLRKAAKRLEAQWITS